MNPYLTRLRAQRDALAASITSTLDRAAAADRDLTDAEEANLTGMREDLARLDERISPLVDIETRNAQAAVMLGELDRTAPAPAAQPLEVRNVNVAAPLGGVVERTYRPDHDPQGRSFLRDVYLRQIGDSQAGERLARHQVEAADLEYRAVATTNFAGLTIPQYLVDAFAPIRRAGRPFANLCNQHELPPDGMTLSIGRGTTGTTTAVQANQNDAASETDYDDTLLTIDVLTAAGQQTMSRQSFDRSRGAADIVLQDLIGYYETDLDSQLINRATIGLDAITNGGANKVTYTDASPTAAELYPKGWDAVQRIQNAVYAGASHMVMHPRRWAWMNAALGSTWPLIQQPNVLPQVVGSATGGYGGVVGTAFGLPVVLDANIATNKGAGTNEDRIYIVTSRENHLWELPGAPLFIRTEEVKAANLGVLMVVYGYFAFTHARYSLAHAQIEGTGLVTPTF